MMSTDIADSSYPRECQNFPFPCANDKSRCMTREMFFLAMEDANRQFCDRYTGGSGGLNATKLSIYPFMQEIKDALFSSVTGRSRNKLTIFSGHDTVIAPVLAALGVYRQKQMCVWPPYASRIAFEVYVRKSHDLNGTNVIYDEQRARELVMVRVLYNGKDITSDIVHCKKSAEDGLCPLGAIENLVNSLISPHSSIEEACEHL